jgi:hypothetical protein
MYVNRNRVFERLDDVVRSGFTIITYAQYLSLRAEALAGAAS